MGTSKAGKIAGRPLLKQIIIRWCWWNYCWTSYRGRGWLLRLQLPKWYKMARSAVGTICGAMYVWHAAVPNGWWRQLQTWTGQGATSVPWTPGWFWQWLGSSEKARQMPVDMRTFPLLWNLMNVSALVLKPSAASDEWNLDPMPDQTS